MSGNIDWSRLSTPALRASAAKQTSIGSIAAYRYDREVAGTNVGGFSVLTDRDTQMKLTAAALRAQRDPTYTVQWKQADGSFVMLTADQVVVIADSVGDYVQACFDREAALLVSLADGSYLEAMLSEGWP